MLNHFWHDIRSDHSTRQEEFYKTQLTLWEALVFVLTKQGMAKNHKIFRFKSTKAIYIICLARVHKEKESLESFCAECTLCNNKDRSFSLHEAGGWFKLAISPRTIHE